MRMGMLARLKEIVKDPEKRAILSWIGGVAVVVTGGIWTAITFVVDHKATHDRGASEEAIEQIQKSSAEQWLPSGRTMGARLLVPCLSESER
jgi:hypothetical protein